MFVAYQGVIIVNSLIDFFADHLKSSKGNEGGFAMGIIALAGFIKSIVWILGILLVLSNFGIDVG